MIFSISQHELGVRVTHVRRIDDRYRLLDRGLGRLEVDVHGCDLIHSQGFLQPHHGVVQVRPQRRIVDIRSDHGPTEHSIAAILAVLVIVEGRTDRRYFERLGDAVRLAAKLQLSIGLGGGLSFRNLAEVLATCPAAEWVTIGRSALARGFLVGLDRALRDLRARIE